MGLRINTNTQSLQAQQSLNKVRVAQENSMAKMSSGSRINKSADDAAGLAISDGLMAKIRGTRQAERNASDGISMIQVAEGGMNEISNILVRLRELSVQSASDTISDVERSFTDKEFQQLVQEVDRISESTDFNGIELLNGKSDTDLEFQVGIMNDEKVDRISYNPQDAATTIEVLGLDGIGVSQKSSSQENLVKIDAAISQLNENRSGLGALQNRLQSTINNLQIQEENYSAANSRIRDVDVAEESANLAKNNILKAASTAVLSQANENGKQALRLIG